MMKFTSLKYVGIAVLVAGFAVGCAQQQVTEEPQPVQEAPEGPSEADQAIADAKAAIAKAKAVGWIWRDTEKTLKKAEEANKKGDEAKAIKLANKAKSEAQLAVKQYYTERGMDRSLPPLEGIGAYTVEQGDSLWGISAKDTIYGDPYQWPLIYKANSDKIKDADLIYPGQEFDINSNASDSEIDAAVRHAKTRGAWSIGVSEDSDQAYLAQ